MSAQDFLARLVGAPSPNPPGREAAVCEAIEDELARLGLPEAEVHERAPGRPNLVLRVGRGPDSGLLIAGHTDTMPAGPLEEWQSDPFELTERGGRLYGLGVADMKVGLAAMVHAAGRLHGSLEQTLTLLFSADEEAGSAYGMQWLVETGVLAPRDAVMAEPAGRERSWDTLYVGQRGSCTGWLVAHGVPGHSGVDVAPEQRASWALVRGLEAVRAAGLFSDRAHPVDSTRPIVNLGTVVTGGESPWVHPSTLRASFDVRTIEGMTPDEVHAALRAALEQAGLRGRVEVVPLEPPAGWFGPGPSVTAGRLHAAAREALRAAAGSDPPERILGATTDASYLFAIGTTALPALGPGTLGVAHRPNESIEVGALEQGIDVLELLARTYCAT